MLEYVAFILAGIMLNTATQYALEHILVVAENHSLCNKIVGGPVEKCTSFGVLWHKQERIKVFKNSIVWFSNYPFKKIYYYNKERC